MQKLEGKIVLITGGSQGLGKATADVLSEEGAVVVIADIKDEQAERCVWEINSHGGRAVSVHLDVSDSASIDQGLSGILNEFGKIDILVNNAAVDFTKPIGELSVLEIDSVIKVNLRGPIILSSKIFPIMEKQGGGQIVNVASTASKRAWANATLYHATKWGLLGFNYSLHVEGRGKNIKVSAVVSGGMKTPFILERFPEAEENLQDPRNVAEVILFLLTRPEESVIPEVMILPMKETSWP